MLFSLEAFPGQVLCDCAYPLHALCCMWWDLGGISSCFLNQQFLWHLSLHSNSYLSCITITSYCLASFNSAGAPVNMRWGSYPMVGKSHLENYTFCTYCSKPKPPRAHRCRSCKMCVVDMDHHCPFIGNCVGASNHRAFVIFLISVVISCSYAAIMTIYASYHICPPLDFQNLASSRHAMGSLKVLMEVITTLASSTFFLSARGLVLLYLAFTSLSVNAGIGVLLCQQLSYIYEGNTYLNHLRSPNVMHGKRGLQNLVRFFWVSLLSFQSILGLLEHWQVAGQFKFETSLEV